MSDSKNSETQSEQGSEFEDSKVNDVDPAAHDDLTDVEKTAHPLTNEEDDVDEPYSSEPGDPYGGHSHEQLTLILEAALFASGQTLSVQHLRELFDVHERPHAKIVRLVLAELMAATAGRGVQLVEVASGYRFQTDSKAAPWVSRLWEEKPQRYSRALLETIALIAYRQPITRGEIEDVRGVAVSSNIVRTLLEREWVRVVGHRDVPGRPAMYATTKQFLDYFGFKSLDQLPSLSDIRDLDDINPQMSLDAIEEDTSEPDPQSELSFGALIDKIRLGQTEGKTGNQFIDEQLDEELARMDDVNRQFESAMEQQRAEHEHPGLDLDGENESDTPADKADGGEGSELKDVALSRDADSHAETPLPSDSAPDTPMDEAEQWRIIQEKLAQQQALLDARENDKQRGDDENE